MHRTETLRLLLAILSFQMYISPENVIMKENKWFEAITVELERKAKLALFCSLLNAIMDYDPVGWAIPYNHVRKVYLGV